MELHFSTEEMIRFLGKIGYKVEEVDTWDNVTEYHNRVVTENYKSLIAYKGERPTEDNKYRLERDYKLDVVFYNEFKKKLLQ